MIEPKERETMRNVFRLDDRPVESLMTPRADIIFLDTTLPLEEKLRRVAGSEHTRFPVCRGGLDEVLGILSTKQLMDAMLAGTPPGLAPLLPAVYAHERLSGLDLLEQFRASDTHLMLVIDEYGEISGPGCRTCWKPSPANSSRAAWKKPGRCSARTAPGCSTA